MFHSAYLNGSYLVYVLTSFQNLTYPAAQPTTLNYAILGRRHHGPLLRLCCPRFPKPNQAGGRS
jgi:hypothetical protein